MIEIFVVAMLASKLRAAAQSKGRSGWWGALGPLFWIGGEVLGFIVGALMGLEGFGAYLPALVGAAVGAVIAWVIVNGLDGQFEDGTLGASDGVAGVAHDPNNPYAPPGV